MRPEDLICSAETAVAANYIFSRLEFSFYIPLRPESLLLCAYLSSYEFTGPLG